MECSVFLLAHLIEVNVLEEWKKDELYIIQARHDRNNALICYMKTRSEEDYYRFLRALIETKQHNTVKRIEGNAALQWTLNPLYPQNSSTPFLDSNEGNADTSTTECLNQHETAKPDGHEILQSKISETFEVPHYEEYSSQEVSRRRLETEKSEAKCQQNTDAAAIAFKKALKLGSDHCIAVTGGSRTKTRSRSLLFCVIFNEDDSDWECTSNIFVLQHEGKNDSMKYIPLRKFALKTARWGHESAVINGCIVTFGGKDQSNQILSSAECIDLNAMTTKTIASMMTPRSDFSCGVIGDKIFACGLSDDQRTALDVCEYYDIINDKWIAFSSMKYKRYWSSGDVLNGILYATGGHDWMDAKSVEAYDPVADSWISCPSLKKERWQHSCATLQGAIYVTGGFFGVPECERYDPRTAQWTECANMKQGRHGHVLVGVDDKLYAIGGGYNDLQRLASVEMYDPRNNKWETMEYVIKPLSSMSAVVTRLK